MKIILKQDIKDLGEEGDIMNVANGFARNYLIPKKLAVFYDKASYNTLKNRKTKIEAKKLKKREDAQELATQLQNLVIELFAPAGEKGKLYGTITNANIADELDKNGFIIDKKKIELNEHIKTVGNYKAKVKLYQDVTATINFSVQRSEK